MIRINFFHAWKCRGVITTKATKTAALVDFWDYNELSLADLKQENSLSILCLFCRIEKINISIILPSKKSLNILGLLCRFEEINIFIILPSKKDSLNILGLLCRIEEINIFIILPSKKNCLNIHTGSSLRNWKNKYFYQSTKHKRTP